jgi:hypothetical protein
VDVDLHTNAQPGEAEIATELVSRWGRGVRHEVKPIASIAAPAPHALGAADRALGWMRRSEGLGPSSYLSRMPPSTHARSARLLVSGIGGELAHGHYYPPDLAAVEALPVHEQVAACATHLKRRLIARRGPTPAGQAAAVLRTDEVLAAALGAGAPPLVALDVFYLVERLRRWGTGADQADIVLPLLTPDLVGAALRLTPRQRRENALPRALVARLVPAWADVPFLCDLPRRPAPMRAPAPRLWQVDEQRELLAAAIDASGPWADAFDVRQVQEMWHQAVVGGASSTDEAVLQRVLWRAAFEEYVAEANGTPLTRPRPIAVAAVGQGAGHTPLPLRLAGWKGRLRRQPVLRRAATSRWGRRLRGLRR